MPGDNRLVTENFLRLNFTPRSGITPGTNDTLIMSCDQITARYPVSISGVSSSGNRCPAQNQLSADITPPTGYGFLYNFFALANFAPTGWHVPTDAEWHALALYLDANAVYALTESATAGANMKETGTVHWSSPNTGATNSTGFTGLPEGARNHNGVFYNRSLTTTWASITTSGTTNYYYRSLGYDNTTIYRNSALKQYGFSVRLLRDNSTDPGTMTGNDGTTYNTVKIGNQVWMAENSAETRYNTGTIIPVVQDASAWAALTTGAKCSYQ